MCESSESAAGPRAKRNVGEDDDNYQKSKPSHSHHAGVRNRSRSLRFDPGQCGNGDYGDYEAEPCEPVHDSDFRKIRASRTRGIIERLPGAEAFRARDYLRKLARAAAARAKGHRFGTICCRMRGYRNLVPDLRISGRWLQRAGFDRGQHYEIEVRAGRTIRAV